VVSPARRGGLTIGRARRGAALLFAAALAAECEPPVDQLEADFVHFVGAEAAR